MIAATPASSKRRAISSADRSDVSAQPWTATRPLRASSPTAMRFGHSRAAPLTSSGSFTAAVPMMTRSTPFSRHVANSASKLDRQWHAFEDALDRAGIDRTAGERAVQIDHVQILEPLSRKAHSLGGRVTIEHGCTPHVALLQAHADAVLQIDSGKQDQRSCPSSPLPALRRMRRRAGRGRLARHITASSGGNWRSRQVPASGSFPDETAYRHSCHAQPWRSQAHHSRNPRSDRPGPPPAGGNYGRNRRAGRQAPTGCLQGEDAAGALPAYSSPYGEF